MVVGTREKLVGFEMGGVKGVNLDARADSLAHTSFSFFTAQELNFDVRINPGMGRIIRESHAGPGFSGFGHGVPHSAAPRIDALVFGTAPDEVTVTSDMLDDPRLEEGVFEVERPSGLVVCESRFVTEIPHSLGRLTVHFTTQPLTFAQA